MVALLHSFIPTWKVPILLHKQAKWRFIVKVAVSWVINKWKNCGHTRQELRKLYHKRQPQVSKASAGKKVISFPLAVNLLEDGQGVTDIRDHRCWEHRKYTYANLMTQAGNKNCHPLWLFKTFTGATKKHSFDTSRSNWTFFGKVRHNKTSYIPTYKLLNYNTHFASLLFQSGICK